MIRRHIKQKKPSSLRNQASHASLCLCVCAYMIARILDVSTSSFFKLGRLDIWHGSGGWVC